MTMFFAKTNEFEEKVFKKINSRENKFKNLRSKKDHFPPRREKYDICTYISRYYSESLQHVIYS